MSGRTHQSVNGYQVGDVYVTPVSVPFTISTVKNALRVVTPYYPLLEFGTRLQSQSLFKIPYVRHFPNYVGMVGDTCVLVASEIPNCRLVPVSPFFCFVISTTVPSLRRNAPFSLFPTPFHSFPLPSGENISVEGWEGDGLSVGDTGDPIYRKRSRRIWI